MISFSYAQDYFNLYKEYLPQEVRNSNELSVMAAENLNRYAAINPELIYFYISDLQLWANSKDTISAHLLDGYLTKLKNYYVFQRSNWAKNQLRQIKEAKIECYLVRIGESYLEDFFNSNVSQSMIGMSPIPVDSEKLNNIVLLYYQQAGNQFPEFSHDRKMERDLVEQDIFRKFCQLAQNFRHEKNTELYQPSIIDEYKTFWYLFLNGSTLGTDSLNFLSNYLTYRYSRINSSSPLSFSFIKVYNYSGNFNYNIRVLPIAYSYNVLETSVIDEPQFMIQGSYSYYLKPVKVPFSKLTFSLSYLWSTFTNAKTTVDLQAETDRPIATFDQRELTMKSLRSVFFSIKTPLIYINRSIVIEGGGLIGLNELHYSFNYHYNSQPDSLTSINYAFSINDQVQRQFIYMPIISMVIDLPCSFSLSAYYSFWLYSFGIDYNF